MRIRPYFILLSLIFQDFVYAQVLPSRSQFEHIVDNTTLLYEPIPKAKRSIEFDTRVSKIKDIAEKMKAEADKEEWNNSGRRIINLILISSSYTEESYEKMLFDVGRYGILKVERIKNQEDLDKVIDKYKNDIIISLFLHGFHGSNFINAVWASEMSGKKSAIWLNRLNKLTFHPESVIAIRSCKQISKENQKAIRQLKYLQSIIKQRSGWIYVSYERAGDQRNFFLNFNLEDKNNSLLLISVKAVMQSGLFLSVPIFFVMQKVLNNGYLLGTPPDHSGSVLIKTRIFDVEDYEVQADPEDVYIEQ